MSSVIEVSQLRKEFDSLIAVNNVTFQVRKGEIFGLLGPNGAGKTTALELMEGIQKPTSGSISLLGKDSKKNSKIIKEKIGVQLQSSAYYEFLKVGELLKLFGSFYKNPRKVDELLELVNLTEKKDTYVNKLSGGQQQRFSIVASLVNNPEIIFLDEPTTGLDPQARHHLWGVIKKIHSEGKTIVITTHYMEEAQELCGRIAIMDNGKIVALDSPKAMIENLNADSHIILRSKKELNLEVIKSISGVSKVSVHTNHTNEYRIDVQHVQKTLPVLMKHLDEHKSAITNIEIQPPNLEDVFLELTGKRLRD